jgi:hypothetical protein
MHCFAGCTQDAIIEALRAKGLWGETSPSVKVDTLLQSTDGVTLAQLAEHKKIPVEQLRSFGLSDFRHHGANAVKIPYADVDGNVAAIRYRVGLGKDGQRFRWRRGDHPLLYGLGRLAEIREEGWAFLVEGESDCWTLWHHGLPALGIPGKSVWRAEWVKYLTGLSVYMWQEPDAQDLVLRIAESFTDFRVIVAPHGIKDPSEAHIQGIDLVKWLADLKSSAINARDLLRERAGNDIEKLAAQAASVLKADDPLDLVKAEITTSYGGDINPAVIVYLTATTRLLAMRPGAMPTHLLLLSQASSGKSYTIGTALRLLPKEGVHIIDAGSPRVLIYDDCDLRHRLVVFSEADSLPSGEDNPAASAVRNLLQDHYLHYSVVMRNAETGQFQVCEIQKPGPTVLITTAVRRLGNQLMSRLFTLEISDEPGQIRRALAAQAKMEAEGTREPDPALIAYQSYLQAKAPWDVHVPFVDKLAEAIGQSATAPRILRDFARLVSLIKAVAVVRHCHRTTDNTGRVVAELQDYATVRELVNDIYVTSLTGSSRQIRQVVLKVADLKKDSTKVTVTSVAKSLHISKMAASRRVKAALEEGWLVNAETRRGYPFDLAVGEPLPEDEGLPLPDALGCNTGTPITEIDVPPSVRPTLREVIEI